MFIPTFPWYFEVVLCTFLETCFQLSSLSVIPQYVGRSDLCSIEPIAHNTGVGAPKIFLEEWMNQKLYIYREHFKNMEGQV